MSNADNAILPVTVVRGLNDRYDFIVTVVRRLNDRYDFIVTVVRGLNDRYDFIVLWYADSMRGMTL